METKTKVLITVSTTIKASPANVWKCWTTPADILKWNNASDDWRTTKAENELRIGGNFFSRMAAKDGSISFDFEGVYTNIVEHKLIEYQINDGRMVKIMFSGQDAATNIVESFEAENTHPIEVQRGGWQNILDNFKKYTESNS